MKKIYIYIVLGASLLLSGCNSAFFSTDSPSAMDAAVFTIPAQTEQVIAGIYYQMTEQNSYRTRLGGPWIGLGTDCEYFKPSDSGTTPDYANYTMTTVGHTDLTADKKHPWAYLTTGIERSNLAIQGIEQYSDTTVAEFRYYLGEALTLRAFFFYEMTKLWGDVPALFNSVVSDNAADLYPTKVDRNVIYEQLRNDLRHAALLMPVSANCPGVAKNTVERCNKEFALGLLARIDLVYAGMALRPDNFDNHGGSYHVQYNIKDDAKRIEVLNEAIWACEQVMDSDGIALGGKLKEDYHDVFQTITSGQVAYNATESLFEIPFADGVRGQFLNRMGATVNSSAFNHLRHSTAQSKSNAKVIITPQLLFSYAANDKRKWVTCHPYSWAYDKEKTSVVDPTVSGKILYQKVGKLQNVTCGKFCMEDMPCDMTGEDDGVNIPIMRYADVLLMYAEASIGSVSGVTPTYQGKYNATDIFNLVRQRAGLSATALTMDNIMQERAWEFTGEFIRKFDLMRWGKFAEKMKPAQNYFTYFTKVTEEKIDFSGTPLEGQISKDIYVRYTRDDSYDKNGGKAYYVSEIYGLNLGENDKPADYISSTETGGWVKSDPYVSDGVACIKTDDAHGCRIYASTVEETLDDRQYWPIFNIIISSNHNLWNDYIYAQ